MYVVVALLLSLNATIVFSEQGGGGTDPQCTSGGPGATSCSGEWTPLLFTTSCSVTCGPGYYACCYLSMGVEATCICKSTSGNDE